MKLSPQKHQACDHRYARFAMPDASSEAKMQEPEPRMREIYDTDYSLVPAEKAAQVLTISLATFFELASQENCRLLIDIPDTVELYIKGRNILHLKNGMCGRPANRNLTRAPLIRVNREIEFLCLEPSECSHLIHRAHIRKKAFPAVGRMSTGGSVEQFDSLGYTRRYPDQRHQQLNILGEFLTFQPTETDLDWLRQNPEPTNEKAILIEASSLLIRTSDLNKIALRAQASGRDFGKFEPGPWTSAMLADLNEASTYFFSSNRKAGLTDKADIRDWLRERWERRAVGKDVLDQATNAILPDNQYPSAPSRRQLSKGIIEKYNEYASAALIIMNEAAKQYWKEMQSREKIQRYAKRDSIKADLQDKGFTAKLAAASAAIIRPDQTKTPI